MPSRLQVYFSGHVQGVGFRYTVRTLSLEFDVTGWVKNLGDGEHGSRIRLGVRQGLARYLGRPDARASDSLK